LEGVLKQLPIQISKKQWLQDTYDILTFHSQRCKMQNWL